MNHATFCAEAVVTQLVQTTVLKIVYNGSNRLQNRVSSTLNEMKILNPLCLFHKGHLK